MKVTKLFLVVLLFAQSSCVTKALWGDKSYQERVNQLFLGTDGRYVVLVGEKYHYIFADNSGMLKVILPIKQRNALIIRSQDTFLKLTSENEANGELVLYGAASALTPEELQALGSFGVRPNNGNIFVTVNLLGRRYAAKYLNQNFSRLENSQEITVYYRDSNLVKNVGKIAVTPIAVGLDAVLLIGKVALIPFE
ncbi:MAG: hypothetical protein KGP29_03120 [Proteobacteria bacterium]|nr:hypothetical protein [Pseudomonadota bacterium]